MCPQAEGRARRRRGRRRIPRISQGVPNEWCAVCGLYEREGLIRRPVTVCELSGLPLTVIGCGCHPSARGSPIGSRCPPLRGGAEAPWLPPTPPVHGDATSARGAGAVASGGAADVAARIGRRRGSAQGVTQPVAPWCAASPSAAAALLFAFFRADSDGRCLLRLARRLPSSPSLTHHQKRERSRFRKQRQSRLRQHLSRCRAKSGRGPTMFSVLVLGKSSGGTHQRGWRDRQEKGLNLLAVGCRCLAIRGWTPSQSQLSCSLPRHVRTQVWVRRRQRRWKDRQSISPARGQINLHSALYTRGRYRFARVRESSREFARVRESSRGFAKDTRMDSQRIYGGFAD